MLTCAQLYCVRPNAGRIEPNQAVDVLGAHADAGGSVFAHAAGAVMLLPMKEDPPMSTKCKDKFLVQSTIISPDKDHLPPAEVVR